MKRSKANYSLDFERFLASKWAGYTWQVFQELEGDEQAVVIAAYRIENRIASLDYQNAMREPKGKSHA